ncbi:hypothetical protein PF010_g28651 [Phytophthora fragariae]|uniref:Uncharacterized protein n=1 Tax=Phytophthora fragariae TaxID=53985 RepID=A0A6A3Q005_9STRA|nr:hypothetical protein PF010_g28651 [Phytophthora fragariae]KAE9065926.1 hypothetical protein PF007_g28672 [Phytophthora fragariae]
MAPPRLLFAAVLAALSAPDIAAADLPVSVQYDATFTIASSRGAICSGASKAPAGTACPLKGDVATADCHSYLFSFDGKQCTAKEDAECAIVLDDTWGCVFPSVSGGSATPCPTTYESGTPAVTPAATKGGKVDGEYPTPAPTTPYPGTNLPMPVGTTPTPAPTKGSSGATPAPAPTPAATKGSSGSTPAPTTPCPEEDKTPAPTTPCPEDKTPAPTTPCPEGPTPAPSTPCPETEGPETPCPETD